ncbi:YppG family protein [Peribacillus sp. SI8-4]|uniref:YppG family protein n=1 Tax=Peribacillus sp. SI8-4 TaxID=3048009 RepID=UPI00255476D9|nr:YppG family protein [Peribacillus sp. SI8-4]
MMRSGFNQFSPDQGQYPHSQPEYGGGYQQSMQYPLHHDQAHDGFNPPYPHNPEGYTMPYPDPYQQGAYHPFQPMQQPAMPVSAQQPGNSVMQPMSPMPQMQPMQQPAPQVPYNPQMQTNHYNQYPQQQAFSPFANPLLPAKRPPQGQQQAHNPYPKQQFMQKPQPSGFKSVMNQFKTQDGSMDITKMMNTAGQMMNTVSQVSSMVKGVGGFFKA